MCVLCVVFLSRVVILVFFLFFKQKTAYEMRISDWSSDVCSSDLLGLAPGDNDFVVVGETPDTMLAAGFKPVGRDFPVFLHPQTNEEHALARTERKSGRGHRGFVVDADPSVTLEEDLGRRDFTINAIAQDADGNLVDPLGGAREIGRAHV